MGVGPPLQPRALSGPRPGSRLGWDVIRARWLIPSGFEQASPSLFIVLRISRCQGRCCAAPNSNSFGPETGEVPEPVDASRVVCSVLAAWRQNQAQQPVAQDRRDSSTTSFRCSFLCSFAATRSYRAVVQASVCPQASPPHCSERRNRSRSRIRPAVILIRPPDPSPATAGSSSSIRRRCRSQRPRLDRAEHRRFGIVAPARNRSGLRAVLSGGA